MIKKTEKDIIRNWKSSELPVVSICCITYNHEKYIAEAMDGFLAQTTNFQFEIIVGDDHSTDNTPLILADYAVRFPNIVKLISHSENIGMMLNFKKTFESCKGKYIALCEGDDCWTSINKLQKQIDFMDKNSDFAICFHQCANLDQENQKIIKNYPHYSDEKEFSLTDLFTTNIANTCSVIYRNFQIEIPDFFKILKLGDWPLHMLHAQYGKIKYFPDNLGIYRIHPEGVWTSAQMYEKLEQVNKMLKEIDAFFHHQYSDHINATIGKNMFHQSMYLVNHNMTPELCTDFIHFLDPGFILFLRIKLKKKLFNMFRFIKNLKRRFNAKFV